MRFRVLIMKHGCIIKPAIFLFAAILLLFAEPVPAAVITADTVWKGEVLVTEDVLVSPGVVLTILPGTIVTFRPSDSTKTDPEYLSPLTELTVRGRLRAEGTTSSPIVFQAEGRKPEGWAGIFLDGGEAVLRSCTVQNAETGIYALAGSLAAKTCLVRKNRYGVVIQGPGAAVRMESSRVSGNEYGMVLINGAKIIKKSLVVTGNVKKDNHSPKGKNQAPPAKSYSSVAKDRSRRYGDTVLQGDTIWRGTVELDGILRIPAGVRLLVMPGTVVRVKKRDTNGDGIGENGLLIQGVLVAKGTPEQPIIFRSAEKVGNMGDWDSINIMNSDAAQNLIEYCQIEDAYRGLHFHFSNVAINASILRNNYRGIQFQESTVEMADNHIYGNKSGIQARDSQVDMSGNALYRNYSGANFFRVALHAHGNTFAANIREGLRMREGIPTVEENQFYDNRYGLMASDSRYGVFCRNLIMHNKESGLLLKAVDNVEVTGNVIQGNAMNGITIQDSRALLSGNDITENGERGIAVLSFAGTIADNSITRNGVYAIGLDGDTDVSAPRNWWGSADMGRVIYDKQDDPSKGSVNYLPVRAEPVPFSWPLPVIANDVTWQGSIQVSQTVTVLAGASLKLLSPATVSLARGADLKIQGRISAMGEAPGSITFTSAEKTGHSGWGEIFLEHAEASVFSNCDFEHATWAVHCHFTALTIERCRFRDNFGGIRFRGGPLEVRHSLFQDNTIGIRAYHGTANVTENNITGNQVGIFVREKGGSLEIRRNNIFGNRDYNIRLGDFNDENVKARENYWGPGDPAESFLDSRNEPGIGSVLYEPFSRTPYDLKTPRGRE